MFPHAPHPHQPTNYWYVLAGCVVVMLLGLLVGLREMRSRFNPAGSAQPALLSQPSAAPAAQPTAAQPTATIAAPASASAEPTADSGVADVDPKTLTASPAQYRSRIVRVRGKVFYIGKLDNGQTWLQIVGPDNVYVDGQMSGPVPASAIKGANVQVTGIGAGLTTITSSNGKDYDQAYIDPIQKIELVVP